MKLKQLIIPFLLLAATAAPAGAQRRVSADVEVKTVIGGKRTTVTKSVYCTNNGRLVTLFRTPMTYYAVSNTKGELKIYNPETREVMSERDEAVSSYTELLYIFMTGHIDDLGLGYFGYKSSATGREDGYIKKTFKPSDVNLPQVEIVYEDYLPIYCAYTSPEGRPLGKKYLSDYKTYGRFILPQRITDINYGKDRDSSVVRTIYSSVRVDVDDPNFGFQIPADAKPAKLEAPAK